jgi:hypothetical protein
VPDVPKPDVLKIVVAAAALLMLGAAPAAASTVVCRCGDAVWTVDPGAGA